MKDISSHIPVIALLGGVGSGKTTAAKLFEDLGCARIDADAIAHRILNESDVQQELRRRWGDGIFNDEGKVDRAALGAIVFDDPAQLADLSAIVHPRVRRRMEEFIVLVRARGDQRPPAVVVDAPVLLEAGCADLCTHLVFIESTPETRATRVGEQRGWDEAEWQLREKSQKALDTKAELCDYTVVNSSSVSHLAKQIRKLLNCIVVDSH